VSDNGTSDPPGRPPAPPDVERDGAGGASRQSRAEGTAGTDRPGAADVAGPAAVGAYRPAGAQASIPVVAVDAMGGDHAPRAIVEGAIAAHRQWGVRVVLVGKPGQIRPLLAAHGMVGQIRLVAAEDSVAMADGALSSWRRPRSSIAVACQLVHLGQAMAVVSAGSTGAVVSLARLRLRILPGVLRPAIAVALPTFPTPTVLIDAGAIADPKPEMLAQFAQLGSAYAEIAFGITNPTVGLLSIGAEPGKGNKLARRAYELLSAEPQHGAARIKFAGNVEGTDLLSGKVDVIVSDGFAGNVALKTLEASAAFTADQFRSALRTSRRTRFGALWQRNELARLRERLDPETYGGAALLGLEGTVVIAHGASTERGAAAACRLAADLAAGHTSDRIRERIGTHRQGYFLRRN